MNHSESLKELATALAKAQSEIENAAKNANNPHFKSKYADLAEIINTSRPVLTKHGLSVVQLPGMEDGRCTVETILLHSSGEWLSGLAAAPIQKADPQGIGSAVTYLRRYSLAAVCAIAQEDDDGESAVDRSRNGNAQTEQVRVVTPDHVASTLRKLAMQTDPETAAEVDKKIAAGLTAPQATALKQDLTARLALTGATA